MSGGRTDERMDGFQPFLSHIRVLSKRIKRGYGQKNVNAVIGLNIPTIPVKI
jgi:hypothetical protein